MFVHGPALCRSIALGLLLALVLPGCGSGSENSESEAPPEHILHPGTLDGDAGESEDD